MTLDSHIAGYFQHGITLNEGDTVFDVGANIGLFTLRVAQKLKGKVALYSFEPVPPLYEVMKQNADKFGPGAVKTFPVALSRAKGQLTLHYYPHCPGLSTAFPELWDGNDDLSKAIGGAIRAAPQKYGWGRWLPSFLFPLIAKFLRRAPVQFQCETMTLSDMVRLQNIDRIDLLKVDVEGAELEVLAGIEPADWAKIQQLVLEVHDVDGRVAKVTELLKFHGVTHVQVEREAGFEETKLFNIYARRPVVRHEVNTKPTRLSDASHLPSNSALPLP